MAYLAGWRRHLIDAVINGRPTLSNPVSLAKQFTSVSPPKLAPRLWPSVVGVGGAARAWGESLRGRGGTRQREKKSARPVFVSSPLLSL